MKKDDLQDDLLLTRNAGQLGRAPDGAPDEGEVPMRAISDVSLGRLAKHKEEITAGVVTAINEIETLRRRQEQLEQEKKDLEQLGKKQAEYERGKREVIEHLNQGIIALEKKEVQSAQLTDLLVASRNKFKELLEELDHIREEDWPDGSFRQELGKAIVIVDDARMEYNKALARIQVLEGRSDPILDRTSAISVPAGPGHVPERSFGRWVQIGFAISLPFWLLAAVLAAAYLSMRYFSRV